MNGERERREAIPPENSPPWAATASVLLALTSLALNESAIARAQSGKYFSALDELIPIVLSAVAILLSRLFNMRLERGRGTAWLVRMMLYGAAAVYTITTAERIQSFYYFNFISRLFGVIFVLESALQHWQRPRPGQPRGGVLVFLAAIIFVLSSRTYIQTYIKFLTPPFIVLLALSMRSSRQRQETNGLHPWLAAIFLAMLMGGLGSIVVAAHSTELTRIMMSIVRPSNYTEISDANTRPTLGAKFNQPLSQKRVLKIEGNLPERYMRGMAFETYASTGAWGPAMEARSQEDGSPVLKAKPGGDRLIITPLIDKINVLYVPLHMDGVDAKSYKLMWARDWGGPIYATVPDAVEPYDVKVVTATHPGPLTRVMNPAVRERCLDMPPDRDPRLQVLADEIGKGAKTTDEKLEALRKYFYKNHKYALSVSPGSGDPVVNFLVKKKDGHCQYFASSAVLLLRCMGVPCRYVTGYYAHESPDPEVTIVRQRDAHAWVEVWSDKNEWVTYEPTPPGGMPGQAGGVSRWERIWEKMGDWAESVGAWMRESPMSKLALVLGAVAAMFFITRWIRAAMAVRRSRRPTIRYAAAGRPFDEIVKAFEDFLKRKGAACPPQRPWLDHVRELKIAPPAQPNGGVDWSEVETFVRDYCTARFGAKNSSEIIAGLNDRLRRWNSRG